MKTICKILVFFLISNIFVQCSRISPLEPEIIYITVKSVFSGGAICYSTVLNEGELEIKERGFLWKEMGNIEYEFSQTASDNTRYGFETVLFGLSPSTTYILKSYATSSAGTVYSEEIEFTTSKAGSFIDSRDGEKYGWVEIGEQIWMAENLRYIPFVNSGRDSKGLIFVYAYNDTIMEDAIRTEEYKVYGCLYNPEYAQDNCPDGWHLPSDKEWMELELFLGMNKVELNNFGYPPRGTMQGKLLKTEGLVYWKYQESYLSGINSTLFSALPGGYIDFEYPIYRGMGGSAYFLTSTLGSESAIIRLLSGNGIWREFRKGKGFSVRCVKDK